MKYDSAEIWWFMYGLTLAIGTLKIMAGAGVFVLVVLLSSTLLVDTGDN
jgi:hypothetical protein